MSLCFHLPTYLCPRIHLLPCIHPLLPLTNLMMLHTLLYYCLTMVQALDVGLVWKFWRLQHLPRRRSLMLTSIALPRCMTLTRAPMHARLMCLWLRVGRRPLTLGR